MDWEAIRENLGLVLFAAIWLLSFLVRAVRGNQGSAPTAMGPIARRRRARRKALVLGVILMAAAVGVWEFSGGLGGNEEPVLRVAVGVLAILAVVAVLFAGFTRPESALQGEIDLETPAERAAEITAGEPLDPS